MTDILKLCRLCMNTKVKLKNLYMDDFCTKLFYCIDLKIHINDGLSLMICKVCERTIDKFYNFKLKCLEVDAKFKSIQFEENNSIPGHNTYELDNKNQSFSTEIEIDIKPLLEKELTDVKSEIEHPNSNDERPIIGNSYSKPINDKESELQYQCELCGFFFKSKIILENHLRSHSGVKQFCCKLCPKRFSRADHKKVHMRAHLGIKPYICEVCGRPFTKRQDLIRHLRIHSDDKKYVCFTCGKCFKRSGDVHSHMRTHTGARPYKCTSCDKCYTSHSGLRKHHKKHCKT